MINPTFVFSNIAEITRSSGKTTKPSERYIWGTCAEEEEINPLTGYRKKISTAWHHMRGIQTHTSRSTQTNETDHDPTSEGPPIRTLAAHKPMTNVGTGCKMIDTSTLRDVETATESDTTVKPKTTDAESQKDRTTPKLVKVGDS